MTHNRLQYTVLISILVYFFLQHIWGVRFTTSDDSSIMLWAHHDINEQFKIIDNIAKSQGRIYFYYHTWYLIFIQTFWDTIVYDLLQTGSLLLSIILITYTLILYTNNKHYFLYPLIYISITPIIWEHTLTTSVPLYHYVYLIKLCLIYILIFKYKDKPNIYIYFSIYILFILSIFGHEYQVFISYLSVLLCLFLTKNKVDNKIFIYPITFIFISYLSLVLFFYIIHISNYTGAAVNLNNFNFVHFLGLIIEWSLSGNIFFELFEDYEMLLDLNFDQSFTTRIPVLSNIILDTNSYLFIIVIYFLLKSLETWTNPTLRTSNQKLIIFLFFAILIILPQFFLALTPKYQYWFSIGVNSYTYSSLSNFAICIVLNKIVSFLLNSYNYIFKTFLFIFISTLFLISNAFSNITSNAMKESSAKWFAWDIFMNSPYSELQSKVRAPRFAHRLWYTPNYESYWNSLTQTLYNNSLKLLIENNNLSGNTNKFIDYYNINDNIVVLYGELLDNEFLINPILLSKEIISANYEYINNKGEIVSQRLMLKEISNNIYEYKIKDIVRLNTIRFPNSFLGGYIYSINNLLKIDSSIEFSNPSAKHFHLSNEWSTVEAGAVWGYGSESHINFSVYRVSNCVPILEFSIEPIQSNETSIIELYVNGELIKSFRPIPKIHTYYLNLNESIFNRNNNLKFKNNFSATPHSLNMGSDNRELSIRLYYLKLSCK